MGGVPGGGVGKGQGILSWGRARRAAKPPDADDAGMGGSWDGRPWAPVCCSVYG